MEKWRLLEDTVPRRATMNLAIEEAIFLEKIMNRIPPTVRFWRNNRAVVVGYSQSVEAEVNLDVCAKEGVEVVRRLSGGGAVYQDIGNLNYSIAIESDHSLVKDLDVTRSLRSLCSGVLTALKTFGARPVFKSSDVLINNRKVSGNAQARRKEAILHHGTLLVSADLNLLGDVLNASNRGRTVKGVASRRGPVTNLSDEIGWQVPIEKVKEVLQQGFERAFSTRLINGGLRRAEKESAEKLYAEKYSRKEWNFWR
jgi:lipoate-protein ligase A